eukprot:INCI11152.1.p2 GENE.INCI11152.1~~INCI11152.1.p2  ORF type:complete len:184 (+),score=31.18 INCI11152.1:197-748(+)
MGGSQSNSKQKEFLNSALTLYDMQVASRLHDFWRAPRRQPDGTFEPRIKTVNGRQFDIANMNFRQLPAKLQYENLISTKILCSAVVKQFQRNLPCTNEFIDQTATSLHEAYQSRNVGEADRGWTQLADEEKEKVRNFVHLAIEVYNDMNSGLPATRGTTLSDGGVPGEETPEQRKQSRAKQAW